MSQTLFIPIDVSLRYVGDGVNKQFKILIENFFSKYFDAQTLKDSFNYKGNKIT